MINIYKMHGTGNTFYIIDEREINLIEKKDLLTIALCKDNTDGVIFVENSGKADVKMRIFNSDGSEPEMCGNGLRCFSRYVLEKDNKNDLLVETMFEQYKVSYVKDFFKDIIGIKVEMKNVINIKDSNVNIFNDRYKTFDFSYFTVSNPHIVSFTDKIIPKDELVLVGSDANDSKDIFDKGINVNLITELSDLKVYVQTYERGVGLTKSCGTGMTSASTYYSVMKGKLNKKIEVYNDGGMIWCTVKEDNNNFKVDFVGNATYIFEAKLSLENYEISNILINKKEEDKYNEFYEYTRQIILDLN